MITFGCRVNQADSLGFEEDFLARGGTAAAPEDSDIVVVNTCSVTASADQAARQTIRRVARVNPAAKIIVTGCYATRRPDDLAALPHVLRVVPNGDKAHLVSLVTTVPVDGGTVWRWGRPLRCGDPAWRRRKNGVHITCPDGLRRAVFVLHYPDDERHACQRAA